VPPPDDPELVRQAQRGDQAAFELLVRRYDRRVLRLALGLVRSEETARDLYQEAFLRIYRSLGRFRHECGLEIWIYRVVTNVCLDYLRRAAADREAGAGSPAGGVRNDDPLARLVESRPDLDPERALVRRELRLRIEGALATLSPRERLVFELRHHQGLRLRAIAEILETSEETVRNCLYRAHQDLRAQLEDLRSGAARGARARLGPAEAGT